MKPSQGDIYYHIPSGLLCLVLGDKPHTSCGAWLVQFLTGNDDMTKGITMAVSLSPDKYQPLETQ